MTRNGCNRWNVRHGRVGIRCGYGYNGTVFKIFKTLAGDYQLFLSLMLIPILFTSTSCKFHARQGQDQLAFMTLVGVRYRDLSIATNINHPRWYCPICMRGVVLHEPTDLVPDKAASGAWAIRRHAYRETSVSESNRYGRLQTPTRYRCSNYLSHWCWSFPPLGFRARFWFPCMRIFHLISLVVVK